MAEVSARDPGFSITTALAADVCDQKFPYSHQLSNAYTVWKSKAKSVNSPPFFMRAPIDSLDDGDEDAISRSSTVPTFLCTDDALDIYV